MNAKPDVGLPEVGGVAPNPGNALTDTTTGPDRTSSCGHPTRHSASALLAATAWHANQAISRHVRVAHAWADLTRTNAEAIAKSAEKTLPPGPVRDAIAAIADASVEYADDVADAAMRYGRRYGHLAFAFPPLVA
jgi:hypothetical protein